MSLECSFSVYAKQTPSGSLETPTERSLDKNFLSAITRHLAHRTLKHLVDPVENSASLSKPVGRAEQRVINRGLGTKVFNCPSVTPGLQGRVNKSLSVGR